MHTHEGEGDDRKCVFAMPGGDVLEEESLKDATIRLLKEQTGLVPGDLAWVFEAEEDGVLTTTFDTDIKLRRDVKHGRDLLIDFVDPCYLIEGQGGVYNKELFELLGLNLTRRDELDE